MTLRLQLAWRGTLLQVPGDLLNLVVIWEKFELSGGWLWCWIQQAATGGFRTEVCRCCCGYLSWSRAGFSLLTVQEIEVDGPKPWLSGKPGYVRDGDLHETRFAGRASA